METMRQSHLYEQVPSTHYESRMYDYPKQIDESPSLQRLLPLDSSVTLSEDGSLASGGAMKSLLPPSLSRVSGQSLCYQNMYRKRENPLYQSISQIDQKSSDSSHGYGCTWFSVLSLALAVLACILSIVGIGITVNTNRGLPITVNRTYVKDLEIQLDSLLKKYDLLLKQVGEIRQEDVLMLKQNYNVLANKSLIVKNEILDRMNSLRDKLDQQISNISRLAGAPPGLTGMANLTACRYRSMKGGGPSAMSETLSPVITSDRVDNEPMVITGVECSTEFGQRALLNVSQTNGITKYQCRCFGEDSSQRSPSRFCYLHYWFCPINN